MSMNNVTLSIDSKVYKKFKKLAKLEGLSISEWVTAKMNDEVISHEIITERKVYSLLDKLSNEQLEEIYNKYL